MRKYTSLVLIFLFTACSLTSLPAQETKEKIFSGMELLSGYGFSKTKSKDTYNIAPPVLLDFNFNLKPLTRKIHINPPGMLEFQIEPFVNLVDGDFLGEEYGMAYLLKLGIFSDTAKLQPYVKAGIGTIYITPKTREQSTHFNYTEFLGAGTHYFFTKNLGVTIEGRYRHLSNCGKRQPNNGINTFLVLAGVALKF